MISHYLVYIRRNDDMGILNILKIWTWINSMDPSVSTKSTSISAPKQNRRCSEKNGKMVGQYI